MNFQHRKQRLDRRIYEPLDGIKPFTSPLTIKSDDQLYLFIYLFLYALISRYSLCRDSFYVYVYVCMEDVNKKHCLRAFPRAFIKFSKKNTEYGQIITKNCEISKTNLALSESYSWATLASSYWWYIIINERMCANQMDIGFIFIGNGVR